jgi:hypothetical protein
MCQGASPFIIWSGLAQLQLSGSHLLSGKTCAVDSVVAAANMQKAQEEGCCSRTCVTSFSIWFRFSCRIMDPKGRAVPGDSQGNRASCRHVASCYPRIVSQRTSLHTSAAAPPHSPEHRLPMCEPISSTASATLPTPGPAHHPHQHT